MRDESTRTMNTKAQRLCLASAHCPGANQIYDVSGYQEELPGRRVKYPGAYPSLKNQRIASAFCVHPDGQNLIPNLNTIKETLSFAGHVRRSAKKTIKRK